MRSIPAVVSGLAAAAWVVAAPRTFTDAVGRSVTLPSEPRRIVSLAPNLTEIVEALGLASRLVGVTDFCRVPEGEARPARVGGIMNPDLERIVSLKPDLVLASTSGNYVEDRDRLERLGIPVFTCDTPDVEAILRTVRSVGEVAGAAEEARKTEAALRDRLDAVAARVASSPRPRVLFVLWGDPLLVPGRAAFITDALSRAGAASVSKDLPPRWAEYDLEQAIASKPEVILTVPDNAAFAKELPGKPGWSAVPAVKNGRVVVLSDAVLQPGPRVVDAVEEIAGILHPVSK